MSQAKRGGYRSLFWPIVLIGAGVVFLLANLGVLQSGSLVTLFRMWPLLLILIGIDILFGRSSPMIGALLGIGAVVLVIVVIIAFPASFDLVEASYSDTASGAQSAAVRLYPSVGRTTVNTTADTNDLFTAEVRYIESWGAPEMTASGELERTVVLDQPDGNVSFDPFGWIPGLFGPEDEVYWEVTLSENVPVHLEVSPGAGTTELDLERLMLTSLTISSGAGQVGMTLPATGERYPVSIQAGVGSTEVIVPEGAAFEMRINGGVGEMTIDLPAGAPVRLDANTGIGSINLAGDFRQTSGSGDDFLGESGVWETNNYSTANASSRIDIEFEGGVGSLNIR